MAAAFNDVAPDNPYIQYLKDALEGKPLHYECEPHPFNKAGEAKGQLIGGNLCLLAHLIGTNSDIKTKGKILFLEDVGEYLYNVDRLLLQLKRSGKLSKLAGLIIGEFSDSKDTERPFGKPVYDIIYEQVNEYDFPVCFGFPVGHGSKNYSLKVGTRHQLQIQNDKTILWE
jgi:muramoyltetrapeptide carboxypeptidase